MEQVETTILFSLILLVLKQVHSKIIMTVLLLQDGYFSVGYFTGDIELVKSLDHDTNDEHTITVHIQVIILLMLLVLFITLGFSDDKVNYNYDFI